MAHRKSYWFHWWRESTRGIQSHPFDDHWLTWTQLVIYITCHVITIPVENTVFYVCLLFSFINKQIIVNNLCTEFLVSLPLPRRANKMSNFLQWVYCTVNKCHVSPTAKTSAVIGPWGLSLNLQCRMTLGTKGNIQMLVIHEYSIITWT